MTMTITIHIDDGENAPVDFKLEDAEILVQAVPREIQWKPGQQFREYEDTGMRTITISGHVSK